MSESFVRLNHASSVESLSAKQVAEKDVNIPEISDPEASEGRKYQHPSLLLLQTKQPMWIPETQVNSLREFILCSLCSLE